ncbi:MAG TPA: TrkH family potassium uptake protein [Acidimicrobiales bacterium]|nr:TrkH family potassium uptake protein [Acidimicrobiales bacterium]
MAFKLKKFPKSSNTTLHVTGTALLFVSAAMLICAIIEGIDREGKKISNGATFIDLSGSVLPLLFASIICLIFGGIARVITKPGRLGQADIFSAVGGAWLFVSLFGALPYLFDGTFSYEGSSFLIQFADSLFESISGYSCTGSTVFGSHNPIESHGSGILLYRQLTQWVGGMGIVVLVVTVLPSLRASGLGLISAEAPGPESDRLASRVVDTARKFWKIYCVLTICIGIALFTAGMSVYDAVAHALTTASTGGFSTRDSSIGFWDSPTIEMVLILGMILGGSSFALHWRMTKEYRIVHLKDPEFRSYLGLMSASTLAITWILTSNGLEINEALRSAAFNVVTLGTSTGFSNATGAGSNGDFSSWVSGPQILLFIFLVFGGCTGSTSGGVKIFRLQIGASHALRSIRKFRRPRGVFPVFHGSKVINESLVQRIAGFIAVYAILVVAGTLTLTALDTDIVTALSGVISALGNMGPALGDAGPTASFADAYSTPSRMVLAFLMLVGRLEIFPMLLMVVAPYRGVKHRLRATKHVY